MLLFGAESFVFHFAIQKFKDFVLYGCETWALILREERRLRVFENRVLRRIFGLKRDQEFLGYPRKSSLLKNDFAPNVFWQYTYLILSLCF